MEFLVVALVLAIFLAAGIFLVRLRSKTEPSSKLEVEKPKLAEPSKPALAQPAKPKLNLAKSIRSWIPLLESKSTSRSDWERVLIESDMGPRLAGELLKGLSNADVDGAAYLKSKLTEIISAAEVSSEPWRDQLPWVLFIVGVNGVGKTTTLVKLAHFFQTQGQSVGVIGADTFRKAAVEQLERGIQRVGADFFTLTGAEGSEGADPAAVVFDGLKKFKDKAVILVDTSGRLHTKKNLMEELKKMKKVAGKSMEAAPHDLWLIIDSTLGQNTVPQARAFHEAVGLTGMIVTKVDGLSRGGTIFQLFQELQLPIRFLGVGEAPEDLKPFKSVTFVQDLFDQTASSS